MRLKTLIVYEKTMNKKTSPFMEIAKFRRKLAKLAENSDNNLDPRFRLFLRRTKALPIWPSSRTASPSDPSGSGWWACQSWHKDSWDRFYKTPFPPQILFGPIFLPPVLDQFTPIVVTNLSYYCGPEFWISRHIPRVTIINFSLTKLVFYPWISSETVS
jgi:hypothetical protein